MADPAPDSLLVVFSPELVLNRWKGRIMGQGQQHIKKNSTSSIILPAWAQELSVKYCSKTANLYFVHGNIRDFCPIN
jgi:hypothetical protein